MFGDCRNDLATCYNDTVIAKDNVVAVPGVNNLVALAADYYVVAFTGINYIVRSSEYGSSRQAGSLIIIGSNVIASVNA